MKTLTEIVRAVIVMYCMTSWCSMVGQTEIPLINPSFEDVPRAGGRGYNIPVTGWFDLGKARFPMESPVDIHSGDSDFWGVTTLPYDSNTFLSLVTRPNGSYESLLQELSTPLDQGAVYRISMFLCQDPGYESPIRSDASAKSSAPTPTYPKSSSQRSSFRRLSPQGPYVRTVEPELIKFNHPVILRIWGYNGSGDDELLAESGPIDHPDWREYTFDLFPTNDYKRFVIEAYFQDDSQPVAGHVLVDKLSLTRF